MKTCCTCLPYKISHAFKNIQSEEGAIYVIHSDQDLRDEILLGRKMPKSGIIEIPNHWYPNEVIDHKEYVGFVSSFNQLNQHLKTYEHLLVPLLEDDVQSIDGFEHYVLRTLRRFDLEDRVDHGLNELTKLEKQKLTLARALIYNPRILIIDRTFEPLEDEIIAILNQLKDQGHIIFIESTSEMFESM